jgi:hypothetical protein
LRRTSDDGKKVSSNTWLSLFTWYVVARFRFGFTTRLCCMDDGGGLELAPPESDGVGWWWLVYGGGGVGVGVLVFT